MRTIHVSPDFPLNRRMRRLVARGKLQVVRVGGESLSLGGGENLATAVRASLDALKARRPIFHSEGDLRHEFGWELTRRGVKNVRAEKPFKDEILGAGRVDLAANGFVAELKYFTSANLRMTVNGEEFVVSGAPHRRITHYNFWEDVRRVERLVERDRLQFGCVICVANYASMWGKEDRNSEWLADFWMTDGKKFPRLLKLGEGKPSNKTWGNREDIPLSREYTLKWKEWHNFPDEKNGRFRYVVVEIKP